MRAPASVIDSLEQQLGRELGPEALTRSDDVRDRHGRGESYHAAALPDIVVYPDSIEAVVATVRLCRESQVPLVPYGAGTSLEGNVTALEGGVSLDLTRLSRILRVSVDDLDATVEAGVTRKQLNASLQPNGVFFPVDPGADATIGGMAATRASGTAAVRYGTMRESVLGLTVVTATGSVVRTGTRARKSAAGYDLTRLFVGSEGTLGVIVDVTVRLHPIPEAISAAVCAFPSIEAAVDCVIQTIQVGVPIARMELLDEVQLDAINRRSGLELAVTPTLFMEFHGSPAGVEEQATTVAELASELGGEEFAWATRQEERERLWDSRHQAWEALLALRPGARGMATDVCVPISRLAQCISETRRDLDASGLLAAIVGHVGDGNYHVAFLVDPDDPDEIERAHALHDRMVARALAVGGTCSGEHGIGSGKLDFLEEEHGPDSIAVMRAIKDALDPDGLFNPGKVLR